MRSTILVLGCASVLAFAANYLVGWPPGATRASAAEERVFVIPANDGYGVADCIASNQECGKVVATAWCETHGFAQAASFGLAQPEDATGSVESRAATVPERPLVITCSK